MAATITTLTSNITAPVDYVLMRGLLSSARKRLPYFNGTLAGNLEKNQGSMSVKWRRIENLAPVTTALGEVTGTAAFGMGRNAVQATITDITVAMAKYGNWILTTEELDLFNVNSRAAQLLEKLGWNAGESLNILARDVFGASTNIRYGTTATATTNVVTAITLNDIKYVVNQLNRQSAMKFAPEGYGSRNVGSTPVRDSYLGIVHPDVEEDIRALTGFDDAIKYGGYIATEPGEFGSVAGVRFISSEIAPIATSAGTTTAAGFRGATTITNDVYSTFIYGKEAVGTVGLGENHTKESYMMGDRVPAIQLISKAVGSAGAGDPFNEVGSLAWKAWFAGKILNQNWLWNIKSLSADL